MYILAPLALLLLLSGCLYQTKEVWNHDNYKLLMMLKFGTDREANIKQLQAAVAQGLIFPQYAEIAYKAKWVGGESELRTQRFIDLAVDETRRQVEAAIGQSKASSGQTSIPQYV